MMRLAFFAVVAACHSGVVPDSDVDAAPSSSSAPSSSASPAASASSSSAPAPREVDPGTSTRHKQRLPPVDDTCRSAADCTMTSLFETCCGGDNPCEQRYTNLKYAERVSAICKPLPADCWTPSGGIGCSWGFNTPQCIKGHCRAPAPRW